MNVDFCQSQTRRAFLRNAAFSLGGLNLSHVLAGRAAAGSVRLETSVILLYLHGGPSQLETYDLKPDAPIEYRSVFNPISTNVPGMDICELFPLQAKIADKFSLVRSLNHDVNIHSDGGIVVLTGKRPEILDPTSQSKSEHPDFGSIASRVRGYGPSVMPPYVAIPQHAYMTRPAYLGFHHAALDVADPTAPRVLPSQTTGVTRSDVQASDRRRLIEQVDRLPVNLDLSGRLDSVGKFRELAFQMLNSPTAAAAFDLSREDNALRDRYGRNVWGQGCLLARRLAEAGTAVISLYINTPQNGDDYTNWDDHIQNAGRPGHFAHYMRHRLPHLDECLSALIEDIFQKNLQQRIMVVVMGEFGRTPRLSHNSFGTGRDHWPQAYTALVSGGGLRMGQVVGATNSKAEYPSERPYSPQDLLATIYRHLGIDPTTSFIDLQGRPIPILGTGEPIRELI